MNAEKKIKELGLVLPGQSKPKALYIPVKQVGNLLFVSGQIPMIGDSLITGKVGEDLTLEQAQDAAKVCVINLLSALRYHLGSLDKVKNIVKIQVFVSSKTGFDKQHIVANAASQLLIDVFGEEGRHARTAVSTNQLPLNAAVEVEAIVEIQA